MCCRPVSERLSYSRASLESLARYVPTADCPANRATLVPNDRAHTKPSHWEAEPQRPWQRSSAEGTEAAGYGALAGSRGRSGHRLHRAAGTGDLNSQPGQRRRSAYGVPQHTQRHLPEVIRPAPPRPSRSRTRPSALAPPRPCSQAPPRRHSSERHAPAATPRPHAPPPATPLLCSSVARVPGPFSPPSLWGDFGESLSPRF